MANPQKEDGNTQIANEILEALIRAGLNGTELACVLLILRKTYGWQKVDDEISLTQFEQNIPVSRQSIVTALNNLKLVKVIRLVKKGNSINASNRYAFNKDYDQWQLVKKTRLVKKTNTTSQENQKQLVKKTLHTKETFTKETIQKKVVANKFAQDSQEVVLSKKLISKIIGNNENHKFTTLSDSLLEKQIQKYADVVRLMMQEDKRTPEQIFFLIDWSQNHDFWKGVVLSMGKFRSQFDMLIGQCKVDAVKTQRNQIRSV